MKFNKICYLRLGKPAKLHVQSFCRRVWLGDNGFITDNNLAYRLREACRTEINNIMYAVKTLYRFCLPACRYVRLFCCTGSVNFRLLTSNSVPTKTSINSQVAFGGKQPPAWFLHGLTRNSCTGRSPVQSIGRARNCGRRVTAYWMEQTWRSQKCKCLR